MSEYIVNTESEYKMKCVSLRRRIQKLRHVQELESQFGMDDECVQ
jgi:hypothetical protein